jgi:HlyD family secretion protein
VSKQKERQARSPQRAVETTVIEFLPDADEILRRPLPVTARITLHLLLVTLMSFIVWASLSEIDVIVSARGRLVTSLPNIVVQPLETSIIRTIDVKMGQLVRKGEQLATLDPTFSAADEAQLRARLKSLETQAKWLEADLENTVVEVLDPNDLDSLLQRKLATERRAAYQSQLMRYQDNVARAIAALETNRKEQGALVSQFKVAGQAENLQEELLEHKYSVRQNLYASQDRRLAVERDLVVARNREKELLREISSLQSELSAFRLGWRQKSMEDLLATGREIDALAEQLQKADKRSMLVNLTAPVDAVVLEIGSLSEGSVVQGAERLITLVPITDQLEAEVSISPSDIGYLMLNADTQLKFDAFPFQKHGGLKGVLRTISGDSFRQKNSSNEAYYLGRINLLGRDLENMPEGGRLLPGMTLTAEISVGKRSVMSYLIWPLKKAMTESIREP